MNTQITIKNTSLIEKILKKILTEKKIFSIILYGSYAINKNNKYSDLDLLVITKNWHQFRYLTVDNISVEINFVPYKCILYALNDNMDYIVGGLSEGIILFDKNSIGKKLKEKAINIYKQRPVRHNEKYLKFIKFVCFEEYNKIKGLLNSGKKYECLLLMHHLFRLLLENYFLINNKWRYFSLKNILHQIHQEDNKLYDIAINFLNNYDIKKQVNCIKKMLLHIFHRIEFQTIDYETRKIKFNIFANPKRYKKWIQKIERR